MARQWIRHRTANAKLYFGAIPLWIKNLCTKAGIPGCAPSTARRGAVLEGIEAARALEILQGDAAAAYAHYEELLERQRSGRRPDPKQGLARELARMEPARFTPSGTGK